MSIILLTFLFEFSSSFIFYLWHSHLGHVLVSILKYLDSTKALKKVINQRYFRLLCCKLAKLLALPINRSDSISYGPFDLIHSYL